MMHIRFPDGRQPEQDWLDRASALTAQLKSAPNKESRDEIIDDHAALWGELKSWLMSFSYDKCWFSEARDTYSHWHVEHFRPKKEAKNPDREGYWWRTFDYLNYRLCGSVGNSKKGSFFPLRPGTEAAAAEDNCDDEAPVLLDPIREADVILLTFADSGIAVPAEKDGWPRERAEKSIERYKLNDHAPLSRARANVWTQCSIRVNELEALIADQKKRHSPTREERIRALVVDLKEMTDRRAPFSGVARAFLDQDPRLWVKRCAA